MYNPATKVLHGVWGTSSSDVFAVGEGGTILHFNGTSWSLMASPTTGNLYGVWGTSGTNVYAVGASGAIRYDGTNWYLLPGSPAAYSIWGSSPTDIYTVRNGIWHYDGTSWTQPTTIGFDSDLLTGRTSVWGSSATDVFVTGQDGTSHSKVAHFDGASWSLMTVSGVFEQSGLRGVWGSSGSNVFAAGETAVGRFNGSSWESMIIPPEVLEVGKYEKIKAVWGSSANNIYFAGVGRIFHYDGSTWTAALASSYTNESIWGSAADNVYIGQDLHYDGASWSITSDNMTGSDGMWGSSASDIYAVSGAVIHYDGSTWSVAIDVPQSLHDVWGSSSSDVFVVGASGTILRYNGSGWYAMQSPTALALYSVWGTSSTNVFAGGAGMILHYDGTSWTKMADITNPGCAITADVHDIWGSSATDVYAVGGCGGGIVGIWHYDGNSWALVDPGFFHNTLYGVWGNSPFNVFAVGYGEDGEESYSILHFDGARWSKMDSTVDARLKAIWGSAGDDVFAGGAGTILHFSARATLTVASANPSSGVAVTVTPPDSMGQSDGVTGFTRTYAWGTTVTLDAPPTSGGKPFGFWTGCNSSSGTTCTVNISGDRAVTANYVDRFLSAGGYDGWVLESSELSGTGGSLNANFTTVRVGDDGLNRQYRTVLSFDTKALPDNAVITSAKLKVRYQGRLGTNPFTTHGSILVDAMRGAFSGSAALQIGDFQAAATRLGAATMRNAAVGGWYSATVPGTYINKKGTSQFRLRFTKDDNNDRGTDYLSFYSGNAATAYRPVLEIVYHVP